MKNELRRMSVIAVTITITVAGLQLEIKERNSDTGIAGKRSSWLSSLGFQGQVKYDPRDRTNSHLPVTLPHVF